MNHNLFPNLSESLSESSAFLWRHLGPRPAEIQSMLDELGFDSLESFLEETLPAEIRSKTRLKLPPASSESETLQALSKMMHKNRIAKSYIGMGYTDSILPSVIGRTVLENPGCYTPYTPYQSEIAQGRLELLFYFQTMICDLTGMELSNASLLDEGTAAAEAMGFARNIRGNSNRNRFFIIKDCHPQTEAVIRTRAHAVGIDVEKSSKGDVIPSDAFAVFIQMPDTHGAIFDLSPLIDQAHEKGAMVIVATALLPLTLIQSPGELNADVVIGTSQPFGIPLGFGGPHAAFFATREKYKRKIPGRLVGISKDSQGKKAYRLALQTREQHIRREKATSNLCTSQVLLANMAALFAMHHGPDGLRNIAQTIHQNARHLRDCLTQMGFEMRHAWFFDTLSVKVSREKKSDILARADACDIHFRSRDVEGIGITIDETTRPEDIETIVKIFSPNATFFPFHEKTKITKRIKSIKTIKSINVNKMIKSIKMPHAFPDAFCRKSDFLTHRVFHEYRSETEFLRFIKRQESKDLSLTTSMIPLGSCTMKLNAAMEMQALSWREVVSLHPFCPPNRALGYRELVVSLGKWLAQITGLDAISFQPNAGSQGEFAGLLAIKAFHKSRGESARNICLIPRSAHGTNPASARMAGFSVLPIDCDENGNTDRNHLQKLAEKHSDRLAALMITYPSTHGVFEEGIVEMMETIHKHGGQVYFDGANLNAQVGLCLPGELGADVCHINLHKTFCIPHGGGGPGAGPIGVKKHLIPFLPSHPFDFQRDSNAFCNVGAISSAPLGNASLMTIAWAYLNAMGTKGLTKASAIAILNANYIARRLEKHFPILYRGASGRVAHECIVDLRSFKKISVEDVAKRLMDYGFHAPTISWPVAGTMMIEPTESESLAELDRFCEAMLSIHSEIMKVENGLIDPIDNPLKNAPHTASMIADDWRHPYSRAEAAFPLPYLREQKFWASVGRVDNVFGDRHPICSCQAIHAFETPPN